MTSTAVSPATPQTPTETATLAATAVLPTATPPLIEASKTPVPLPAVTLEQPQGRAQLIAQLQQVQTEVIGLVETQQQLLTFPRPDDPEWAGDVAVQAAFIQANRLALESLDLACGWGKFSGGVEDGRSHL